MIPSYSDLYWTNPVTGVIQAAPYIGDDFPIGEDGGVYGVPLLIPPSDAPAPPSSDSGTCDDGMSCLWIG
jgi:hypothetical protein